MMMPSMSPNNNFQEIVNRAEMMLDALVRSNQMNLQFAQYTLNLFKQNIENVYRAIMQNADMNGNIQPDVVDRVITNCLSQCGNHVQSQIASQQNNNNGMMFGNNNNNNNSLFGAMHNNNNGIFNNGGNRSIFTDNNNAGAFMAPNNTGRHQYGANGNQSATSVYGDRQRNDVRNQVQNMANNIAVPTNNNNNNDSIPMNNNTITDPSKLMETAKPIIPRIQSIDVTSRVSPTLTIPIDKLQCIKIQQFKGTEIDDFNAYTINYPFLVTNTDTFINDIKDNVIPVLTPTSEYFNVKKPYFISIEHTVPVLMKVANSEFAKIYDSLMTSEDMKTGKLRGPLQTIGTISHLYYNVINNTLCKHLNHVLKYYLRHTDMRVVLDKMDQVDSALMTPCDDIKWLQAHDKFSSRSIKQFSGMLHSLFYNGSMCDITNITGLRELLSLSQLVIHTPGFSSVNHLHYSDNEIISNVELLSKLNEYTMIRKKKTSIITNLDFNVGKFDSSGVYVKKQFENETDCVLGEYIPIDNTFDTTLHCITGDDSVRTYSIGYDLDNLITVGK